MTAVAVASLAFACTRVHQAFVLYESMSARAFYDSYVERGARVALLATAVGGRDALVRALDTVFSAVVNTDDHATTFYEQTLEYDGDVPSPDPWLTCSAGT